MRQRLLGSLRLLLNRREGGERERGTHLRAGERLLFGLRGALQRTVRVVERDRTYVFECKGEHELYRARTLLDKEPGTIQWIDRELMADDVFYDIGANIGLYTIYGAHRLVPPGVVYAFEPHAPTFSHLLRNIELNGLRDRVHALSCALHMTEGLFPFNYRSLEAGSSDSQLCETRTVKQRRFEPAAVELKQGVRVDTLIRRGIVRPPSMVKLDVDGNELLILRGMKNLLRSPDAPRAIQVEVNPRHPEIGEYLERLGYQLAERHYTIYQQRRLEGGVLSPESAGYNGIFRKA